MIYHIIEYLNTSLGYINKIVDDLNKLIDVPVILDRVETLNYK